MWLSKFIPLFLSAVCLYSVSFCPSVHAADGPFAYPSNWGGTGLMEIPTARIIRENSYRLGFSQIKPYRYYYGAISPLKGLEIDGRITEVLGVQGLADPQYGNYKDKALDMKYQFISEGKYMPALAIGMMDPHGTRVYPSQYIAASKQIFPFDFTLGFGNGRFGKNPLIDNSENIKIELLTDTKQWVQDSQFFWGIQFAPSEKFAIMVEYSPIKYDKQTHDPAQKKYFNDPVPSRYNFGLRYKPTKWTELDLSFQRGNEIGGSISFAFDIGVPIIPIYDPVFKVQSGDAGTYRNRVITALHRSGFSDIQVHSVNGDLWLAVQNDKYFYNTRALGIILNILSDGLPETSEKIYIILKKNGISLVKFSTTREDVLAFYAGELTFNEFLYISQLDAEILKSPDSRAEHKKLVQYGIKPSLETFLNDPSGFFRYRLGLSGWAGYYPWEGAAFIAGLEGYPLNNISTSNTPLSIPVRSDIPLYKREKAALGRLMFDQIYKITPHMFGKFSAGLLEIEYAGIDGELAMPVFDGRVFLGISGSAVKKRDPDNPFALLNKADDERVKDLYTTAFFNARLNIHEMDLAFDAKAGRFLAGDKGVRFTVSKVVNGVTIWAWYSFTDTSVFNDSINNDYHDKGIGVSIPLRLFKGTDSKTAYSYSLSPWTRDTAQDIDHFNTLFNFIERNTKNFLDKDKEMMFK